MKKMSHKSAKASHYSHQAKEYDAFNEANSKVTNQTIETLLKNYKVKSVLDLTCGTGSQVFWLLKRGFAVVGSDINANMLKMARTRAKTEKRAVKFIKGDMRTSKIGQFDAVITIFNAIGHLTKSDFEKAIRNIYANLNPGGLYIFDIYNLSYLLHGNNVTTLTIDWQTLRGNTKSRIVQYSTIDKEGILASYTTSCVQKNNGKPQISHDVQTLQIYSVKELKKMLERNGFKVQGQCAINGEKFEDTKSERIVMIAKKPSSN
ncbi:MAG: class I SAM-dependent methyltransferase [Candidatus Berkiella sp.]